MSPKMTKTAFSPLAVWKDSVMQVEPTTLMEHGIFMSLYPFQIFTLLFFLTVYGHPVGGKVTQPCPHQMCPINSSFLAASGKTFHLRPRRARFETRSFSKLLPLSKSLLLPLLNADRSFFFSLRVFGRLTWDSMWKKVLSEPLRHCQGIVPCLSRVSWNPACLGGLPWPCLLTSVCFLTTDSVHCLYLFLWLMGMFQLVGSLTGLHTPWEQGMCALSTRSRTELRPCF